MKLLVHYNLKNKPVSPVWIRTLSSLVLGAVKGKVFEKNAELSVLLTGDAQVRGLNKKFRGKDKTTDVLSFSLLEGKRLKSGPGEGFPLGDVVLSVPQARRRAARQGKDFRAELALLLTHGILHLLGYDHVTKAQETRMFGLQNRLLKKFGTKMDSDER